MPKYPEPADNRAENRRRIAAWQKEMKRWKRNTGRSEAQVPLSYVLLKDGRQVELHRSMVHLKELRRNKEAIILFVDGQKTAIPWEAIEDISSRQF